MKIAQIAPLAESVPPRLYGGTERVVSYLTEELVRIGHQVTLFASGDSVTRARLVACAPRAQRLDGVRDGLPQLLAMLERVLQRQHEFDVLHFHTEPLAHFPLFRALRTKTVTTLHSRLDLPELQPLFREFSDMPVVSISDSQRTPAPGMNWLATVYHGLSPDVCPCNPSPRTRYFAFLGRVSPEKGLDRAIEIAKEMGAKRAVPLPVSAPFHCPLMQPAAEAMRDALSYVVVEPPAVPLYANVTAQPETDADTIRNQLVEQVTGMVRWRESVANMFEAGVHEFVEVGGKVLGPMVKRIAPDAQVTSVIAIEDIEALTKEIA